MMRNRKKHPGRHPQGRWLYLAVVPVIVLVVVCLYFRNTPQGTLCRTLDSLQQGHIGWAERYVSGELGFSDSRRARQLQKAVFATLHYSLGECYKDGDTATVSLSITVVDVEGLLADTSQELLEQSLNGKKLDDRYYRLLADKIKAGGLDETSNTITVKLLRGSGGRWYLDAGNNKDLLDALSGGIGPF